MRVACSVSKVAYFTLAVVMFGVSPTQIGFQELGSASARAPAAAVRARQHLIASPFGTIHAALFSFPQPAGSGMPDLREFRLASLDLGGSEFTGSLAAQALQATSDRAGEAIFPEVDRTLKGDRLVPHERPSSETSPAPQDGAGQGAGASTQTYALASVTPTHTDPPSALDRNAAIPDEAEPDEADIRSTDAATAAAETKAADVATPATGSTDVATRTGDADPDPAALDEEDGPSIQTAQIYFGVAPMGDMLGAMQPWVPDDMQVFEAPSAGDAAIEPRAIPVPHSGETIASKGEVTGEGQHPKSPAERLGLDVTGRAKAEKCLADAVYYEARGEPVRGQIAVAQVVMNRVFSGYYPGTVCGVVYQNSHRHLACQFTFACDGIPERVTEPDAWVRAKEIARGTLDGKLWLPDVGKATHYHASWVRPGWVHEMRKLDRVGVHTFYRPRNWGDGAAKPVWGDAASTTEAVKKL